MQYLHLYSASTEAEAVEKFSQQKKELWFYKPLYPHHNPPYDPMGERVKDGRSTYQDTGSGFRSAYEELPSFYFPSFSPNVLNYVGDIHIDPAKIGDDVDYRSGTVTPIPTVSTSILEDYSGQDGVYAMVFRDSVTDCVYYAIEFTGYINYPGGTETTTYITYVQVENSDTIGKIKWGTTASGFQQYYTYARIFWYEHETVGEKSVTSSFPGVSYCKEDDTVYYSQVPVFIFDVTGNTETTFVGMKSYHDGRYTEITGTEGLFDRYMDMAYNEILAPFIKIRYSGNTYDATYVYFSKTSDTAYTATATYNLGSGVGEIRLTLIYRELIPGMMVYRGVKYQITLY